MGTHLYNTTIRNNTSRVYKGSVAGENTQNNEHLNISNIQTRFFLKIYFVENVETINKIYFCAY